MTSGRSSFPCVWIFPQLPSRLLALHLSSRLPWGASIAAFAGVGTSCTLCTGWHWVRELNQILLSWWLPSLPQRLALRSAALTVVGLLVLCAHSPLRRLLYWDQSASHEGIFQPLPLGFRVCLTVLCPVGFSQTCMGWLWMPVSSWFSPEPFFLVCSAFRRDFSCVRIVSINCESPRRSVDELCLYLRFSCLS